MSYRATNWAYDMKISGPAKPVLVALADMADEAGSCYPGQGRLAEMTGLSVPTVARALKRLETLGLLARSRRFGSFGYRTSDRYTLQLTVVVPETLPITPPTRQRAYKAESQVLPITLHSPTYHSDGAIEPSVEPSENHQGDTPLSSTCGKHPNGTTKNCRACGDARRKFDSQKKAARDIATPLPPRKADLCPEHEWNLKTKCTEQHEGIAS